MNTALRTHVAALALLLPLSAALVAQPAAAQQRAVVAQPTVHALSLNSSAGLAPGATLRLQMQATPGARDASVTLGSSGVRVPLRERGAGNYVGTHTIRRAEHIDPLQAMTARVVWRERTVAQRFSFPPAFQALAMGGPAARAPVIERFVMRPVGKLAPGRELRFRLVGLPGADASMRIPGVAAGIDLKETRPGVYEGSYTIRRRDDLGAFDRAVATLRSGNQRATARLEIEERQARDERPPQISGLTPSNGERIEERRRTEIFARVSDDGSGVDPASLRLRVDGLDVTQDARVTGDEVRYREELGRGNHTAELLVRDRAGNAARTAWTFRVI